MKMTTLLKNTMSGNKEIKEFAKEIAREILNRNMTTKESEKYIYDMYVAHHLEYEIKYNDWHWNISAWIHIELEETE